VFRQGGSAARGRGAAGGRGQEHFRDSSPIVLQREQKRTEGARESPRECLGTPHLQHRDSGRGSRGAWRPRPYGLSFVHPSRSAPLQGSSVSASVWSGAGARAGAKSLAGTRFLVVDPRAPSQGPLGWGGSGVGRSTGAAGWGAGSRAGGVGFLFRQGLRPPRLPPSIPGHGGGPWRWPCRTSGIPCKVRGGSLGLVTAHWGVSSAVGVQVVCSRKQKKRTFFTNFPGGASHIPLGFTRAESASSGRGSVPCPLLCFQLPVASRRARHTGVRVPPWGSPHPSAAGLSGMRPPATR
jgi:hypothetical protein